jgi:hypothetical protein
MTRRLPIAQQTMWYRTLRQKPLTSPSGNYQKIHPKLMLRGTRRKYRKIMVKFEEKMRESNTLFKEEQRILDISRRLSEQNE